MAHTIKIEVASDYDGYFEGLARKIVGYVQNPKYNRVIVTAGPWRSYGMAVNAVKDDPLAVNLDFYSAIRAGFGSLSEADLQGAAKMLEG